MRLTLVAATALVLIPSAARAGTAFVPTSPLLHPRERATVTALANGGVLVAGGASSCDGAPKGISEAELWDPKTSKFSAAGTMPEERCQHRAVALADGRVVLLGGTSCGGGMPTSATSVTIWSPSGSTWTTSTPMPRARAFGYSATLLDGDRILVVGGMAAFEAAASVLTDVDVFDAKTSTWTTAAPLPEPRLGAAAAKLPGGRIMIAGGSAVPGGGGFGPATATTFLYDPSTNTWAVGPAMPEARTVATAIATASTVYIVGGDSNFKAETVLAFDVAKSSWSTVSPGVGVLVGGVGLSSGKLVLLSGSFSSAITHVFDPSTSTARPVGAAPNALDWERFSSLSDGSAFGMAGCDAGGKSSTPTAFHFLQSANGAACTTAEVCSSGICAKGVCATTCSADTECASGTFCKAGACGASLPVGTQCAAPRQCLSGACLDGWCCTDTTSCAPYTCSATGCRTACTAANECATGFQCTMGVCVPAVARAVCTPDLLTSTGPDGTPKKCSPYRCDTSTGECQRNCISSDECGGGFVCQSESKECVAASAANASQPDSGGCAFGASPFHAGAFLCGALVCIGAMRRRRRPSVR